MTLKKLCAESSLRCVFVVAVEVLEVLTQLLSVLSMLSVLWVLWVLWVWCGVVVGVGCCVFVVSMC